MHRTPYSISQNFTVSQNLLAKLDSLIIPKTPLVLDIGAGKGHITKLLITKYKDILAIEPDYMLAKQLKTTFDSQINLIQKEFSPSLLPKEPFSVVSNIPFRYTSEILNGLLQSENFAEGLLIMQKEAIEKFGGMQVGAKRTYISTLYEVEFDIKVVLQCKPTDFSPVPKVAIEVLQITRKTQPLIAETEIKQYQDFVAYAFNKSVPIIERAFPKLRNKPIGQRVISTLTTEEIINLYYQTKEFSHFYRGYAQKIASEQKNIKKIFRTRKAKGWKKIM